MAKREKKFFRICPVCDKQVGHTTAESRNVSAKKRRTCKSCSNTIGKKGKPHSAELRAKYVARKKIIRDAFTALYGEKTGQRKNYRVWAEQVKKRNNFQCQRCDTVGSGCNIHAHHVIPKEYFFEKAFDISNGITLCNSCHRSLHADLDRITLEGIKLTQVGFQEHAAKFIATGKTSSQTTQNPHGYKPVFQPMVSTHKE